MLLLPGNDSTGRVLGSPLVTSGPRIAKAAVERPVGGVWVAGLWRVRVVGKPRSG